MGMSFSVYVGPFIRVPTFQRDVTVTRYECSGCGNRNVNKSTPFCPKCGKSVLTIPETNPETAIPRPYDLAGALGEQAFIAESSYSMAKKLGFIDWIPNIGGFGTTLSEYTDGEALVLDDAARSAAMTKFLAHFQPMVDAAEALFGVKVQVLYGAVPYSH